MRFGKKLFIFTLLVSAIMFSSHAAFAEKAHERRIRLATDLIETMTSESDADSLGNVIKSGRGVAIFPAVTKGGLIVGGQTGEGVVFIRNKNGTWSGPAFMGISGASFGLQIGVQSVGLVLVITNEEGLRAFTGGNSFKLGAGVSVAAGPVGRNALAATDGRAKASIYSYSVSKGLYAGISLDGSVINQNRDANKAYWGRAISASAALKRPATDKKVAPLIAALKKLIMKAKDL
ncbi:MAG: lipid-binding SYLF domain-containing protein [Synergistaceae bacterium]|nr:lipid-binding SYLF domain-containing protein [Synergistaceae bacterium]